MLYPSEGAFLVSRSAYINKSDNKALPKLGQITLIQHVNCARYLKRDLLFFKKMVSIDQKHICATKHELIPENEVAFPSDLEKGPHLHSHLP
jgi:hypothetical protein